MNFVKVLGIVVGLTALFLLVLFVRRMLIVRGGGTVELSLRLYRKQDGRGWALGLARFSGDNLNWYRMFSFGLRPRRILSRSDLVVLSRRDPTNAETIALMSGSVVIECITDDGPVELAMNYQALTGFLSWLESAAPGRGYPPYAA